MTCRWRAGTARAPARRRRASGGGPRPDSRSVDRLPRTGGTAYTAVHREVAAHPAGAPRRCRTSPRRHPDRCRPRGRSAIDRHRRAAPVTADPAALGRTKRRRPSVVSRTAASGALPTSRFASAAAGTSSAPDGGTARWARPGRPTSWTVVSAPGRHDQRSRRSAHAPPRTAPVSRAAAARAGRGRGRTARRPIAVADQLPAARGGRRVDAGEAARPSRPRRPAPRSAGAASRGTAQLVGQAGEVAKPGAKPQNCTWWASAVCRRPPRPVRRAQSSATRARSGPS